MGHQLELALREDLVAGWLDKTTGRRRYLGRLCGSESAKASLTLRVRQDAATKQSKISKSTFLSNFMLQLRTVPATYF